MNKRQLFNLNNAISANSFRNFISNDPILDYLDKFGEKNGLIRDYSDYKEALNHSSKLDNAVSKILQRKDNGCGKLIFCHFREEIDEIYIRLKAGGMTKVATFDGRTSASSRESR